MRRLKGSIQKHGKRWRVFATLHDAEGNPRRVSRVVDGTRADAERELARMLGADWTHDATVADLLDAYLSHAGARVGAGEMAQSTYDGYVSKIERSIRPGLGWVPCPELTSARVNTFMDGLKRDRSGVWRVLRLVIRWGIRNGYVASDALSRAQPVKSPPPKVRKEEIYDAAECEALLNMEMPAKLKTAVVLALSCGLRRGEICGLVWGDLDGEYLAIRRAWGKDRPKSEASDDDLLVPQWALDYLEPLRGDDSEPIVGLEPDSLTRLWRRQWFDDKGRLKPSAPALKYIPLKNLRHTSLSLVYELTEDIKAASRRGRHSSVTITERFYVRPGRATDQRVADALDSLGWEPTHIFAHDDKKKKPGQMPGNGT